jgi:hypothetical protein
MLKQTEDLKSFGFEKFISIKDISDQINLITNSPGIYLILRSKTQLPDFLVSALVSFSRTATNFENIQ